jgi:hypothetical protein
MILNEVIVKNFINSLKKFPFYVNDVLPLQSQILIKFNVIGILFTSKKWFRKGNFLEYARSRIIGAKEALPKLVKSEKEMALEQKNLSKRFFSDMLISLHS